MRFCVCCGCGTGVLDQSHTKLEFNWPDDDDVCQTKKKKGGEVVVRKNELIFFSYRQRRGRTFFPFFFLFFYHHQRRQIQRWRCSLNWDVINNLRLAWYYLLMLDVFGLFKKKREMTQEQKKIALAFISLSASFSSKIALSIIETHTQYSSFSICRPLMCLSILY